MPAATIPGMPIVDWLEQASLRTSPWAAEGERLQDTLRATVRVRGLLDELEAALVLRLRREHGLTWREVGGLLGVSAQTAHRRHARALRR